MKSLIFQFVKFFGISGLGWCFDFSLYLIFTQAFDWPVFWANYLSSIPAVSLVFFVSTRNIFRTGKSKIPIGIKYLIYLLYQIILLSLVSILGEYLALYISKLYISKLVKIFVKIIITPITMFINFLVMKIILERGEY